MLSQVRRQLAVVRETGELAWKQSTSFVRSRILGALLLLVLASVLTALGPLLLQVIIDAISGATPRSTLALSAAVGAYVLSLWFARNAGEYRQLLFVQAERRVLRTLTEQVFSHVMHLPLRYHLERQTGAIQQSLENGLNAYRSILQNLVFAILPAVIALATVVVVFLSIGQPVFLLLFAVAFLCYGVAYSIVAMRILPPARAASASHVEASAAMTDALLNYETIKYFAAEQLAQERVTQAQLRTERQWVGVHGQFTSYGLRIASVFALFVATTIGFSVWQVRAGALTLGEFVLINMYLLQLMGPVEQLGVALQSVSQSIAMLDKLLELLREPTEIEQPALTTPPRGPGTLEFQRVSVGYRQDRNTLKDISFSVPAGHTLGVVGASGAGKSTLVRLIMRMLEPDEGQILLDGTPISAWSRTQLRQSIAVVPQDTVLFDETIRFNIGLGKPGCTPTEIEDAAKRAQLHDAIMRMPAQYDTRVGERGVKLSGGEKQRLSIARALLKDPLIFVFDEATSSLDSATEREILESLTALAQSRTTLVIAHRLSTVAHALEILVLEAGQIVERGTPSDLLEAGGRYAALWNAQHGKQLNGRPREALSSDD